MDTTMGAKHMGACMRCGSPVWEGCTHVCSTGPNFAIQQTFHPLVADPRDARIAALEQQLAEANERLAGKWISVEERLPEIGIPLLFTTNESAVELGMRCFDDTTQIFQCERTGPQDEPITFRVKDGQVTFWQPLPAPPVKGE